MSAYFVKTYYKLFKDFCDTKDIYQYNTTEDAVAMAGRIFATMSIVFLFILIFTYFKCNEMS